MKESEYIRRKINNDSDPEVYNNIINELYCRKSTERELGIEGNLKSFISDINTIVTEKNEE